MKRIFSRRKDGKEKEEGQEGEGEGEGGGECRSGWM